MIGSGSYNSSDVTFLLKDLSGFDLELDNEVRESLKSKGVHYSKMLPVEREPNSRYMEIFKESLDRNGLMFAEYIRNISEKVLRLKGEDIVIVSLARAGTPVGVLMKRYLNDVKGIDVPHYSVSIIRGVGLDLNAIRYILNEHPGSRIQFVDGWTGKGAITNTLKSSGEVAKNEYGISFDVDLAVIADPGGCAEIYATREDWLLPNACLNSTVSGLVSRTVFDEDLLGYDDFHGAKFYEEFMEIDQTLNFVDTISRLFNELDYSMDIDFKFGDIDWRGISFVERVSREFGIRDINLIKPSIGETTRVLLRRVPRLILVKDLKDPNVGHVLDLAVELGVEVIERTDMPYSCCGLIKEIDGDTTS